MAVCDLCKGTGRLLKPWYDTTGLMTGFTGDICFKCDGKGTIGEPMTNEEWFCQLPTEEKAVIFSLLSYRCNICDGTPTNQCPFDRCVRGLKDFIKWLKQPHNTGGRI